MLASKAEETDADMVFMDIEPFADNDLLLEKLPHYKKLNRRKKTYKGVRTGLKMMEDLVCANEYNPNPLRYIVRKELFEDKGIRLLEGVLHEDNSYSFEVLLKAERVSHVMKPFYKRRLREGSIVMSPASLERVRGYLENIKKMKKDAVDVLGSDLLPSYVKDVIGKSIRSMFLLYRNLSAEEREKISELAPSDRRMLLDLTDALSESERIIKALNSEKAAFKEENRKLKADIDKITLSSSYRIGRVITFIPRKIRAFFKK